MFAYYAEPACVLGLPWERGMDVLVRADLSRVQQTDPEFWSLAFRAAGLLPCSSRPPNPVWVVNA